MAGFNFFNQKRAVLNGILSIVFGAVIVAYPGVSVQLLAIIFGLFLLLGGLVLIYDAYKRKTLGIDGLPRFILGVLSAVLGVVILSFPQESISAFLLLSIGIWAIISGSILIWTYVQSARNPHRNPVSLIFGIVSLLFGLYLAFNPVKGTYGIATIVGIYAIIYGLHTLFFSIPKNN